MAPEPAPQVGVIGAAHLGLAAQLAARGVDLRIFEPDPVDAVRLSDMAAKGGLTALIASSVTDLSDAHLLLMSAPFPGPPPPIPRVALGWPSEGPVVLNAVMSGDTGGLFEVLGADVDGHLAALAAVARCDLVHLPSDALPPSAVLRARLSVAMEDVMLDGATPVEIDTALEAHGLRPGPFLAQDRQGIEVALAARRAVFARLGEGTDLPLFARAVAEGRLGRKVGVGWYRYPGNGGAVEDPLIEDMAAEEAHFAGIIQGRFTPEAREAHVLVALRMALREIAAMPGLGSGDVIRVAVAVLGMPVAAVEALMAA